MAKAEDINTNGEIPVPAKRPKAGAISIKDAAYQVKQNRSKLHPDDIFIEAIKQINKAWAVLELRLDTDTIPLANNLWKYLPITHYVTVPGFVGTLADIREYTGLFGYGKEYDIVRELLNKMVKAGLLERTLDENGAGVYFCQTDAVDVKLRQQREEEKREQFVVTMQKGCRDGSTKMSHCTKGKCQQPLKMQRFVDAEKAVLEVLCFKGHKARFNIEACDVEYF